MSTHKRKYDIVIVGSGAGGGTVAKELAPLCKSGARIALLEMGGRTSPNFHSRRELEMANRYYIEMGGLLNGDQDITFAIARGVGGGTNVYTGTSLVGYEHVFRRWQLPSVTMQDLLPRYEKYKKENNVHLLRPTEINVNNQMFQKGCQNLDWHVEQFPLNTKDCIGLATCNLGCAVNAKQGTAVVQIPAAESQGVEVISYCRVDRVAEGKIWAHILAPQNGLPASPWPLGDCEIEATTIILCGGAFATPGLLLSSYGENRWPALGRHFTCHPATVNIGMHPGYIGAHQGAPKTFFCEEFHESHHFLLESCFYYPFTLSKNVVGHGAIVEDFMSHYNNLQLILSLAIDESLWENRIRLKRGRPLIDYHLTDQTLRALENSALASAKIFFAAGARKVHVPFAPFVFEKAEDVFEFSQPGQPLRIKAGQASIASAHLMGGCAMGTDEKRSVTDEWGRLHGLKSVYVADASLFPSALEINPYLTIMAFADRVAEAVKKDLGVQA